MLLFEWLLMCTCGPLCLEHCCAECFKNIEMSQNHYYHNELERERDN